MINIKLLTVMMAILLLFINQSQAHKSQRRLLMETPEQRQERWNAVSDLLFQDSQLSEKRQGGSERRAEGSTLDISIGGNEFVKGQLAEYTRELRTRKDLVVINKTLKKEGMDKILNKRMRQLDKSLNEAEELKKIVEGITTQIEAIQNYKPVEGWRTVFTKSKDQLEKELGRKEDLADTKAAQMEVFEEQMALNIALGKVANAIKTQRKRMKDYKAGVDDEAISISKKNISKMRLMEKAFEHLKGLNKERMGETTGSKSDTTIRVNFETFEKQLKQVVGEESYLKLTERQIEPVSMDE